MEQSQAQSEVAKTYTWGIEIECFIPYEQTRRLNIVVGGYHHGAQLPAPFPAGWQAQSDGSLHSDRRGVQALEIVSPILKGEQGILEVKQVLALIRSLGGCVNATCGLHVHVGTDSVLGAGLTGGKVCEWVSRLLYQVAQHERALYASTGTRRREGNGYCKSIKQQKALADSIKAQRSLSELHYGDRYHVLNLQNLLQYKRTVEFRGFAGTLDTEKVVGHICMALALCERATEVARLNWDALASKGTYDGTGEGTRALYRFEFLTGWKKGKRQFGNPVCTMAGWIAPLADLEPVKAKLARLAKKYDQGGC